MQYPNVQIWKMYLTVDACYLVSVYIGCIIYMRYIPRPPKTEALKS